MYFFVEADFQVNLKSFKSLIITQIQYDNL